MSDMAQSNALSALPREGNIKIVPGLSAEETKKYAKDDGGEKPIKR